MAITVCIFFAARVSARTRPCGSGRPRRLPSLATLQTVGRRSIALAFPVYTAGLLLGIIRAVQVDVSGWWLDPRIMMAGVVGLFFVSHCFRLSGVLGGPRPGPPRSGPDRELFRKHS